MNTDYPIFKDLIDFVPEYKKMVTNPVQLKIIDKLEILLDRFNVEATSYDFLKIFNVKAQIPIPKKLKEWLPRAIFAFYCASVFAYGKARVFTDKESEKDKVFVDNEKLIYAVAKYFIKDFSDSSIREAVFLMVLKWVQWQYLQEEI